MFIGNLTEIFLKSKHCPKLTFTKEIGTTRYKGNSLVFCTFVGVLMRKTFILTNFHNIPGNTVGKFLHK